jgi:protein-L-isoaspartate(D-aspartate) O-methyltransferase
MTSSMMTLLTLSAAILLSAARCASQGEEAYDEPRRLMVEEQLRDRDIEDPRVLAAMGRVPRHLFVPSALRFRAYADHPLPIGNGQTISQPYIVALMTQLAEVEADDVVLEIGTGSGYQAAVLSEIAKEVYTIEIVPDLAETAKARLAELGYEDVTVRTGDGYLGWKEKAPFDAILVTAAAPEVPPPLVEQLAPGAILVIPVGPQSQVQSLLRIQKAADGTTVTRDILPVVFVPLVRERR